MTEKEAITINIRPTEKQYLVYQALLDPVIDVIFFGGGGGGGKSWVLCESRLVNCLRYPGYRSFIGRQELKRLMQSTFVTWNKVCAHHKIPADTWWLDGKYNAIKFQNGSQIDLLDLAYQPSDPLYERFGSLEYTDGAVEEAGETHFMAFDVLKSRVGRHMNKEYKIPPKILITANPKRNWCYVEFYKKWRDNVLPVNHAFIQSLYTDNPYTAVEYGKQLSSITDRSLKERLMYGNWSYEDNDDCLVNYDASTDLFTNTVPPSKEKYIVADIARFGKDKTTIFVWEGLKVTRIQVLEKTPLPEQADVIRTIAANLSIPYSRILIDEDGIGGGVLDILRGAKGFVANTAPFEIANQKENFTNLKSQCAYKLADLINNHGIAISCSDVKIRDSIIEDLKTLKRKDPDKNTKLAIIPKDQMKELLGRSPDFMDAMIMRMYFEIKPSIIDPQMILRVQRNRQQSRNFK